MRGCGFRSRPMRQDGDGSRLSVLCPLRVPLRARSRAAGGERDYAAFESDVAGLQCGASGRNGAIDHEAVRGISRHCSCDAVAVRLRSRSCRARTCRQRLSAGRGLQTHLQQLHLRSGVRIRSEEGSRQRSWHRLPPQRVSFGTCACRLQRRSVCTRSGELDDVTAQVGGRAPSYWSVRISPASQPRWRKPLRGRPSPAGRSFSGDVPATSDVPRSE